MRNLVRSLIIGASLVTATDALALNTDQRLELLERRVDRVTELTMQVDTLMRDNRQLRGDIESLQHEMEQLKRKQRDLYLDVDQRLNAVGGGTGPAPVVTPNPVTPSMGEAPRPAPVTGPSVPSNPVAVAASGVTEAQIQAEYQAAYDLLSPQVRRYPDAVKAFAGFVQKYPQHELAANAQYWLGEAHYVSQDNPAALSAFEQLVAQHPQSSKVPGALYKIGRIQYALGKPDEARATLDKVVRDHASAPAAGLARQMLERIQRETR